MAEPKIAKQVPRRFARFIAENYSDKLNKKYSWVFFAARAITLVLFLAIAFDLFPDVLHEVLNRTLLISLLFVALTLLISALSYDLVARKQTGVASLVIKYVFLTISVMMLYGVAYFFIAAHSVAGGGIVAANGGIVNLQKEVFYFSAVTYFTVGYGDLLPSGFTKNVAVLEMLTGSTVNLIVIAIALLKLNTTRQESNNENNHSKQSDLSSEEKEDEISKLKKPVILDVSLNRKN